MLSIVCRIWYNEDNNSLLSLANTRNEESLFSPIARSSIVKELEQVSQILDDNPGLRDLVFRDLVGTSRPDTGRQGLTAEQVLRCAVLKQYRQLSYEELAFHLEDSDAFWSFSRLNMGQYPCGIGLIGEIRSGTLSRPGITVALILKKGMKYREPGCDRQRLRIYRKVTMTTGAGAVLKQGLPDGH